MNQPKTARVHMSLRNSLFVVGIVLTTLATGARAQQSLGDIVKEYNFDWLIGKWVGQTSEGDKIQVIYKWELDKHLVTIDLKWPDYEHRGMIFYMPAADEVIQIGVDNKGGTWKGTWTAEANKGILKIEHTKADGEIQKMAIIYSKVDAKTMKTELYGVRDKPRDISKKQQKAKDKSIPVQESKKVP